jgi:DNA invertase Pin-like site-specific DNA recombinase
MAGNRAITYLRVSTEDQGTMYGLPSQRGACQKRAKERGWTIVRELTDDLTGTDTLRPGLTEVRRMISAGEADIVLCYSVDRLSRDLVDVLNLTRELQEHAAIEYATESFENSASGRLFLSLRGAIGAFEREQILARTQAGRIAKAKSGKVPGGRACYGYRIDDGLLVIHEAEAAVVRRMFEWAASGVSQREIARRLNDDGVAPYMADRWGKTSVGRLLGQETYVGVARYNTRKRKKTILRPRPIDEHITIPVPAIVSRELFDSIVAARARNKEMLVGRPSTAYMLTSILSCSCGARMCGDSGSYRCIRRTNTDRRDKECKTQVPSAYLDELIWTDGFLEIMTDTRRLRAVFTAFQDELRAKWDKGAEKRKTLEDKIAKLAVKEKRTLDMMVEMESLDDRAALKAKRQEMRAERLRHDAELKAMAPVSQLPDIDEWVRRTAELVEGHKTVQQRRAILRESKVEIIWDGEHPQMNIGFRNLELVPPGGPEPLKGGRRPGPPFGGMLNGPWPPEGGSSLPLQDEEKRHSEAKGRGQKNCPTCSHDWPSRLRQDDARQAPRRHPATAHLRRGHRNHQGPQHRRNPGTWRRTPP